MDNTLTEVRPPAEVTSRRDVIAAGGVAAAVFLCGGTATGSDVQGKTYTSAWLPMPKEGGSINVEVHLRGDIGTWLAASFGDGTLDNEGTMSVEVFDPDGKSIAKKKHGPLGQGRHPLCSVIKLWGATEGRTGKYRVKAQGGPNGFLFFNYRYEPTE